MAFREIRMDPTIFLNFMTFVWNLVINLSEAFQRNAWLFDKAMINLRASGIYI